jgi:hypothetical protein
MGYSGYRLMMLRPVVAEWGARARSWTKSVLMPPSYFGVSGFAIIQLFSPSVPQFASVLRSSPPIFGSGCTSNLKCWDQQLEEMIGCCREWVRMSHSRSSPLNHHIWTSGTWQLHVFYTSTRWFGQPHPPSEWVTMSCTTARGAMYIDLYLPNIVQGTAESSIIMSTHDVQRWWFVSHI